jgi:hypothetical protein
MTGHCSLRLELVPSGSHWGWRYFHRSSGENQSITSVYAFNEPIDALTICEGFDKIFSGGKIDSLYEYGEWVTRKIFPGPIEQLFYGCDHGDILFAVPPQWADVPFELLVVKPGEFLCSTFKIGAIITLENHPQKATPRLTGNTMTIIADPACTMPAAYEEGNILSRLASSNKIQSHLLCAGNHGKISDTIKHGAIVHYCGHSHYGKERFTTGWLIGPDTYFNLNDIEKIAESPTVPWLIFSNSCDAGTVGSNEELSGIAGAFLKAGVRQVVGPIKRVNDTAAKIFAEKFYNALFKGLNPAESLLKVKKEYITENDPDITPLLYRLYGDPCFKSAPDNKTIKKEIESQVYTTRKRQPVLIAGLVLLVIIILLILFWPLGSNQILYIPAK